MTATTSHALAHCRSCGAPIRWATTRVSGQRIPLDAEPVEGGNVEVLGEVAGEWVVKVHKGAIPDRLGFLTHFVTCPDAGSWRKRR